MDRSPDNCLRCLQRASDDLTDYYKKRGFSAILTSTYWTLLDLPSIYLAQNSAQLRSNYIQMTYHIWVENMTRLEARVLSSLWHLLVLTLFSA